MREVLPTVTSRLKQGSSSRRSLDIITDPFAEVAGRSASLVVSEPGRFVIEGQDYELPRYLFIGPRGGGEPLRIGIFAGLHGDEPAASFGLLRFVRLLEERPDIAQGYCLFLYPVCNPTGFIGDTRGNRNGRDLNREFWRSSSEPEVRLLESELWSHAFDGLISLHTDDTSEGLYGYAHGPVLTEHLLRPALAAAERFLPRNQAEVIDGFRARDGVIRAGFDGILRAPPGVKPRPFEVILETPHHAPQYLQESAVAVALHTILSEYRNLTAYAPNL